MVATYSQATLIITVIAAAAATGVIYDVSSLSPRPKVFIAHAAAVTHASKSVGLCGGLPGD